MGSACTSRWGLVGCGASLLEQVLDAMPEAIVVTREGRVVLANAGFTALFGYAPEECVDEVLDELVIPEGRLHESEMMLHEMRVAGRGAVDTVRLTRAGTAVDVSVLVAPVTLEDGAAGMVVRYRDIRKEKVEEARLRHRALHDELTGLANRALFLNRVQLTMARLRRRPDRLFAVIFADLDGFKQVNDTHGHAAGDALLLRVSERLVGIARPQDTVARFGGDEFAVLIDECAGAREVAEMAERIQAEVSGAVALEERVVRVSVSLGIALASVRYGTAEELMRDADAAMYEAKRGGKARHVLFAGRCVDGGC